MLLIVTYVHTTFTVHFKELHLTYFENLFLTTNALKGCRIWKAAMMIMQLHLKATSPAFSHFFLLIPIFYSCLSLSLLRVFLCLFRYSYLFLVLLLFSTCQPQNRKPCHANCLTQKHTSAKAVVLTEPRFECWRTQTCIYRVPNTVYTNTHYTHTPTPFWLIWCTLANVERRLGWITTTSNDYFMSGWKGEQRGGQKARN